MVGTAQLTASSIPEPDTARGEVLYNPATTYALGARVIRVETHRVYESLIANNTGNTPELNTGGLTPKWLDVGATNRYAAFDLEQNTQSFGTSPVTMSVFPGQRVSAVALMNMVATTARLQISTVADGVIFDETRTLTTRNTATWYQYFFGAFRQQKHAVFLNLPPVTGATFTITLTGTGTLSLGAFVLGMDVYLGGAEYGTVDDVLNFSKIERDLNGTATLIKRRNVPTLVPPIFTDKARVPAIRQVREDLNATPAVWVGLDDDADDYFDSLLILGVYKRFAIDLRHPQNATINLELEEI